MEADRLECAQTVRRLPSDGLLTFLFTDIAGSTQLWEHAPEAMKAALALHDTIMATAISRYDGFVFRTLGDSFAAVFLTPVHAIQAAFAAQQRLQTTPWDLPTPLRVRMSVHLGEVQARNGDYFGTPVNRVARILAAAHGDQVLVSQACADAVRDTLPDGMTLAALGRFRLRDLQGAEEIFQLQDPNLRDDFPPLKALESFEHNLNIQFTSFVGRETEIARVKQMLPTMRLITLLGSGGVGKTRLALQIAADVIDIYANGVWMVDLAGLTEASLVPQTVAVALGIDEAELIDTLSAREMLLILDNCEHVLDVCAEWTQHVLLKCPRLCVLATSRVPLNLPGESLFSVPPLSAPESDRPCSAEEMLDYEAVRLFCERAQRVRPEFRLSSPDVITAVARICARLDGMPLALELAAARLSHITPTQIASRLDDRFTLLTQGPRTALPRHQTLRAAVDWSYDLLTPQERRLFARLSVFSSGWSLEAAEAVCTDETLKRAEVLDLLSHLIDHSLVTVDEFQGQARYRLLETLREYAAECLNLTIDEANLRRQHHLWYRTLAQLAEGRLTASDQAEWLKRLDREHDNLRTALAWAFESSPETVLDLARALHRFWYLRGYLREGRQWLERALALSPVHLTLGRAKALNGVGIVAWAQGDLAAAETFYTESLTIARHLSEREMTATLLNNLAILASVNEDMATAAPLYYESLALYQEMGNAARVADVQLNLSGIAILNGDNDEAKRLLEQCRTTFHETGDTGNLVMTLCNLGEVSRNLGDYRAARSYFGECLSLSMELGDRQTLPSVLANLAFVFCGENDYVSASRLLGSAASLRDIMSVQLTHIESGEMDEYHQLMQNALGDEEFLLHYGFGKTMTLEETTEYVLRQLSDAGQSQIAYRS